MVKQYNNTDATLLTNHSAPRMSVILETKHSNLQRIFLIDKHRATEVEKSIFLYSIFVHKFLLVDMKSDIVFLSSKRSKFKKIEESVFPIDVRINGRSQRLKISYLNLTCVRV